MGRTRRLRRLQLTRALLKYHTHTHKTFPSVSAFRFFAPFLCNHPPQMRSLARHDPTRARRHRRARARLGDSVADSRRRSRSSSRARVPRSRRPRSSRRDVPHRRDDERARRARRRGPAMRRVSRRGSVSFAASDSGFYVCVRCGTQTQSQVEDAAETTGGGGGPLRRRRRRRSTARGGLRRRVGGSRREGRVKEVRLGKRALTAMRDGRRAVEAYASAFQAALEAQCALVGSDGASSRGERTVRTTGERRARAFGVGLDGDGARARRGTRERVGCWTWRRPRATGTVGDAGEEKTSTEKTSLAREMTKRLPMVMSLGIVYVACARRREAVLPVDLSRMAAEGTAAPEVARNHPSAAVETWRVTSERRYFSTARLAETVTHARTHRCGGGVRRRDVKIRAQLPPINASALLSEIRRRIQSGRARGRRRSTRVVALSVPGASVRVKTRRGDAGIDVVRLLGGDVEISVRFRREDDDDKATPEVASPTGRGVRKRVTSSTNRRSRPCPRARGARGLEA